jgi:hypothetical protein
MDSRKSGRFKTSCETPAAFRAFGYKECVMPPRFLSAALRLACASFLSCVLLVTGRASAEPAAASACDAKNLLAGKAPIETDNITGDTARVTDSAIGHDGAAWDAPPAVTFTGAGSLTYDLGAVRSLSAAFIQADGNDTYRLSGSVDGTPGSYQLLGEFANVRRLGHGLRGRTLRFAPASARFLRVSEGNGDGAFSIAELAAYCTAPAPFPPVFRVEGPSADAPEPASESLGPTIPLEEETASPAQLPLILAAAALLVLGGVVSARRGRVKGPKKTKAERAVERETARVAGTERLLRFMFFGSGCAALIYEVVWFHLMRLVIGASALSVGIVLASFMGGMFLGSLLFPRYVPPERHPLRVYGLLEIGVGVFGLAMPLVLPAVRSVYLGLVGYGPLGIALRGVIATVLLLPPTALMGATLPAIARRYPAGRRGMSALAWLYTTNTAGAVIGSLLSAFYLLALYDVWVATLAAAALNFTVGALGVHLSRTTPHALPTRTRAARSSAPPKSPETKPKLGAGLDVRAIYVVAGLSGLTSLGGQVLWTRLLTLLFGATVFAFAIILAVFLAGLGLGSAIAAYLLRRGQNAVRGLGWSQVLLVPALFVSGLVLARYLPFASPPAITPVGALHGLHVVRALVVILPSAVLWGASFPFALAAAAASGADTGRSSAYVYAANTIGAIAGALGVSFWLIPSYGSGAASRVLAAAAGVSAAVLFFALSRPATLAGRRAGSRRYRRAGRSDSACSLRL